MYLKIRSTELLAGLVHYAVQCQVWYRYSNRFSNRYLQVQTVYCASSPRSSLFYSNQQARTVAPAFIMSRSRLAFEPYWGALGEGFFQYKKGAQKQPKPVIKSRGKCYSLSVAVQSLFSSPPLYSFSPPLEIKLTVLFPTHDEVVCMEVEVSVRGRVRS